LWCSMRSPPRLFRWGFRAWRNLDVSSKSEKRDIYQNSRLPLWSLRRNASFHVVAMDAVFAGDAEQTRELMAEISGLVEQGAPRARFHSGPFLPAASMAAFRLMAGGKHTGKVVVAFSDAFCARVGASRPRRHLL